MSVTFAVLTVSIPMLSAEAALSMASLIAWMGSISIVFPPISADNGILVWFRWLRQVHRRPRGFCLRF